jgi:hypothetical protein
MRFFPWRRRALDDFAEAIRPELRSVGAPEPSPELRARILASRAAGARVILPESVTRQSTATKRIGLVIAVAAAFLLVFVPLRRSVTPNEDAVVARSTFFGREAFAYTPARGPRPALPAITLSRPNAIRPLTLEFARLVPGGATQQRDTVMVAPATVDGIEAWRITLTARDGRHVDAESLHVARSDLRLLTRVVHVAPYSRFDRINIRQRFVGDSVLGRMTTDGPSIGEGRPIARRLRPEFAPYVPNALTPLLLMATPLSATWSGSASLLGWAVISRDVFVPIELRVAGEERVRVPAGAFDCWHVVLSAPTRQIDYWVRKTDGLAVRLHDPGQSSTSPAREVVLTKIVE